MSADPLELGSLCGHVPRLRDDDGDRARFANAIIDPQQPGDESGHPAPAGADGFGGF
jgi:hypothetical protein